jgi:hypothetical protein
MEEFREAGANKHHERDLHVRIKEMHTHMREIELKEEEELKQCEALKKWRGGGGVEDTGGTIGEAQKEMCYIISLHTVGSTLCVVISINMCCIPIYFMYCILIFYAIIFSNSLSAK